MTALLKRTWRTLLWSLVGVLVTFAILVQLGRQLFPEVRHYQDNLQDFLSKTLRAEVTIGEVSGVWEGLRPEITVKNLTIRGSADIPGFSIEEARLELGIVQSFLSRRFYWRKVELNDLSLFVYQTDRGGWSVEGFEFKGKQRSKIIDDPFDIFLFGREVIVNDVQLSLRFEAGTSEVIQFPRMYMENSDRFHRLTVDAINSDETTAGRTTSGQPARDQNAKEQSAATRTDSLSQEEEDVTLIKSPVDKPSNDFLASIDATIERTRELFGRQQESDAVPDAQISNNSRARLIVEGIGDPRIDQTFKANAYLQLKDLQMTEVIDFLPPSLRSFFDGIDRDALKSRQINTELWASGSQRFGYEWRGLMKMEGDSQVKIKSVLLPRVFQTYYEGAWQPEEYIEFRLPEFSFLSSSYSLNVPLQARYRFDRTLDVSVAKVDATEISALLLDLTDDRSRLAKAINKLQPEGQLNNVLIQVNLDRPQQSVLFADATDLSIEAYLGAPQIKHVNAALMLGSQVGEINIKQNPADQPIEFQLPKLYERPWFFTQLAGSIYYRVAEDNSLLHLYSGSQSYSMQDPYPRASKSSNAELVDIRGNVELSLAIPLIRDRTVQGALALTVTADEAQLRSVPYVVPGKKLKTLQNYLASAAEKGRVSDARFSIRTPLRRGQDNKKLQVTTSLSAKAHNAELSYQKGWPAVLAESAEVGLQDGEFTAKLDKATLGELTLARLNVDVNKTRKGHVYVQASTNAPVADYVQTLQSTPLQNQVQTAQEIISLTGRIPASLNLLVPLKDLADIAVDVKAELNGQSGFLKAGGIAFTQAEGLLQFTTERGLQSSDLAVNAFGGRQTLQLDLAGLVDRNRRSTIRFSGQSRIDALQKWLPRPEWELLGGSTQVEGDVQLGQIGEPSRINLQSDLYGVTVALPAPLGKKANERRPLAMTIELNSKQDQDKQYRVLYADRHLIEARMLRGELDSLTISTNEFDGKTAAQENSLHGQLLLEHLPGTIYVNGDLERADLFDWLAVKEKYSKALEKFSAGDEENAKSGSPLAVRAALNVDAFSLKSLAFNNAFIEASSAADKGVWNFRIDSEEAEGESSIDETGLLDVRLSRLKLPSSNEKPDSNVSVQTTEFGLTMENPFIRDVSRSVMASIDISQVPRASVKLSRVFLGEEDYGTWSFRTRPINDGVQFLDILGEIKGLKIGEPDDRATLAWRQKGVQNLCKFEGRVFTRDVGQVLERFGNEAFVRTKTLRSTLSLEWRGAPDQFSFHNAKGRFSFLFRDGNFIRGAEVGENPILRLFGLFNFDTVLRRLKLDFSDLAKQGYAFEKFKGIFELNYGLVKLRKPVTVESTTSKVQMVGYIDLLSYKMDTQILVTLPVASNLTVAAALVAGIPTALGIYAVSKLFKTQMEGVSSIVYSATGPWSDPDMRVISVRDK